MKHKFESCAVRLVVAVALVALPALAQAPAQAAGQAARRIPRLSDGKPNLNGIWQVMNTANWDLVSHEGRYGAFPLCGAICAEPGGLGVVDGGTIPYLPAAEAQKKKNFENRATADPEVKCFLPGVPRATYMPYPFQIFQNSNSMAIAYQYAGAYRDILLKDPGPAPADSWMGKSVARWEGDTLVVTVTDMNDASWLDRAGDFHTEGMRVVERYTLVSPDVMNYEATIEDAKVFSRPWKISMPIYRHLDKNARLLEFKCVEFVEELLYGQYRKK